MAHIRKLASGRFQASVKDGKERVATKTFDRKRDAQAWAERTTAAISGGLDHKAGKARLRDLLPQWLEHREAVVVPKTYGTDKELLQHVDATIGARQIASITRHDIEAWLVRMQKNGKGRSGGKLSHSTIARRRDSLSAFFTWALEDGRVTSNPVRGAKLPRMVSEPSSMHPFSESELETFVEAVRDRSDHLADIVLVLSWTGLRWGEVRAMRVSDVRAGNLLSLHVSRSQSEDHEVKTTKSSHARTVPVVNVIEPIVERFAKGKRPGDLLFTGPNGGQLWGNRFRETTGWRELSHGRRIHDLRHTAACLWLSKGVDLSTVQTWLGHSSPTVTAGYLHYLGTTADTAAVELINSTTAQAPAMLRSVG